MPLHWHANLPGPVAYSRPLRKSRGKSGCLTTLVVWCIVKPLELTVRGLAAVVSGLQRPHNVGPAQPVATAGYFRPSASHTGWYDTAWGPLYWNGSNWYTPDGESIF